MKRLTILITFLFLGSTLLLTSCSVDELNTPQLQEDVLDHNRRPVERPFKGDFIAHPQVVSIIDGVLTMYIEADGNATHLGKCTWVATQIVDDNANPAMTGEFTFTAANGDQIWGDYDGIPSYFPDGSVSFVGTMYVEGGDGRFEGADGELPYYGGATLFPPSGFFVFHDGTLIY